MSEETVTFNLELNTEQAFSNLRQLEMVSYRTLGLIRRLGLPEAANQFIADIQRMVMAVRLLHTTLTLLESGTTFGWIKAILTGFSLMFMVSDSMNANMRRPM